MYAGHEHNDPGQDHMDHHARHDAHLGHGSRAEHSVHTGHAGRQSHHEHMLQDFRKRFWASVILTLPVLAVSPAIQSFLGLKTALSFPGASYVLLALASAVYLYGGWPFLRGMAREISARGPSMMTLIALAITVSYVYRGIVVLGLEGKVFFWELTTLIEIMLAGHWIEMRSVMGASRALEEIVKLVPSAHTASSPTAP